MQQAMVVGADRRVNVDDHQGHVLERVSIVQSCPTFSCPSSTNALPHRLGLRRGRALANEGFDPKSDPVFTDTSPC